MSDYSHVGRKRNTRRDAIEAKTRKTRYGYLGEPWSTRTTGLSP